ncbi:MAG: MFS transporter [Chloroflexi bacterium]|nr:MFS transporter [Chloroflexota bacterium]
MLYNTLSRSSNLKWWAFAAVAVGTLTSVINNGSVIVALPTIARHFGTDLSTVQWVVIAESLTVSALLLPMGRLSDLVGRKQVYITGLAIFIVGAIFAATSTSIVVLIVSKVLQGGGAAMTQGTGMAMITSIFPPEERGKGIGSHASVVGTGGVLGPVVGGFLVGALGWQWVFYINVIMGAMAIAAALLVMDSRMFRRDTRRRSYDWLGAGLSTGILVTFLLAVTNGSTSGWTSPPIVTAAIAFAAMLGAFIWWELRSESPMLDLRLFRRKVFAFGVSAGFISFLGISSVRFLMPFYLQAALGLSPGQVGLIMVPNAISRIITGPISGRLSDRYGWRIFNVIGLLMSSAGLFVLATLTDRASIAIVLTGIILQSAGSGIFQSPNSSSIFSAVESSRHGVVSALLSLTRNSANVTGVAIATAIVAATMASMGYAADVESVIGAGQGSGILHAFTSGLRTAYLTMGCLLLAGVAVSFFKGGQVSQERAPHEARETRASA